MKSINELYQEVISDEELRNKFLVAYEKGEIEGFLKDNDCDASLEEALEFIEQEFRSGSCELSEEELALVVGGKGEKDESPKQPKYHIGDYVQFDSSQLEVVQALPLRDGRIITEGYLHEGSLSYHYDIRVSANAVCTYIPEDNIKGRL